jgi:hypothetical protein
MLFVCLCLLPVFTIILVMAILASSAVTVVFYRKFGYVLSLLASGAYLVALRVRTGAAALSSTTQ